MEAHAPHRDGPFTVEEFARLPEEDPYRIELAHGWLVREPRPGARHGVLVGELYRAIDGHARERRATMLSPSPTSCPGSGCPCPPFFPRSPALSA